jgi:ABC-2 type transport system permease protein/lipopolysaccharide transport system permease protein
MDVRTSGGLKVPHAEYFPPPPAPREPNVWLARIAQDRRELVAFWPVIRNMVEQELKVRYQRSFLGFMWTLLNPLLMLATLGFVFSHLLKNVDNYTLFLFAGMVP